MSALEGRTEAAERTAPPAGVGAGAGTAVPAKDPRVVAEIERIAALLHAGGREADSTEIMRQFKAPAHAKPALFVAGEDKRGKSCLVNALLSRPDLSPVGVEVVTAAPITFTYSSKPWAKVFRYGEAHATEAEFDDARALATVAGNPRNEQNVRAVQLAADSPLLRALNLIDTPGVGGLDSGHGALTIQSLRSADALLFVTEAGAQFRSAELSFLRRASARVDTVILVLTKIDLHRGWRTILEDDLAIIREQAPRFANCPVVPVSSLLALRALQVEDPEDAEELRKESGLTQLEEVIQRHVVERSFLLRDANLLRAGHGSLGGVMLTTRQTLAAVGGDGAARAALEAEQARLQQLQKDRSKWPQLLDSEIRKLTLERSELATRGTVEIKTRYDERIRNVKKHDFDSMPGEFVADLTALAQRLNETAADRLTKLVDQMLADLDEVAHLNESIQRVTGEALAAELADASLGDFGMTGNDRLSVLSSFSSGRSLGSLAGAAAGSLIAPPIGLALGLGMGAMFAFSAFMTKDQHAFVAAFQPWSQAQISKAQVTINTSFQRQMIDVQLELRDAIGQALADREQEINASLKAAQQLQAAEAGKRKTEQARLQKQFDDVRATRAEIEQLLKSLAPRIDEGAVGGAAGSAGAAVAAR